MRTTFEEFKEVYAEYRRFSGDESGSLTIFSLFLFMILLMMSGMAVDLIRAEHGRVGMQNTLDTAVLAASSMTQKTDAETLVKEYVSKAGYDASNIHVNMVETLKTGTTTVIGRDVSASTYVQSPTMFMDIMGIDRLRNTAGTAANDAFEKAEISLVLDISNSMNEMSADPTKTKMQALETAAIDFINSIFEKNDPENITISIIPYNHQVYIPDSILSQLSVSNQTVNVNKPPSYPGTPITSYQTSNSAAPCAVFDAADYQTTSLIAGTSITRSASFTHDGFYWERDGVIQQAFETPYEWTKQCGHGYAKILPFSNNQAELVQYIKDLYAYGGTAINIGMNWGVGMLDPDFNTTVKKMVTANDLPNTMSAKPTGWNTLGVSKYVVLMTDGQNMQSWDLKPEYKSGPSRIWYSPSTASASSTFAGYFVEMPSNDASKRWYQPKSPLDTMDDTYVAEASLPTDAVQLDYHAVYQRFGIESAAKFFFQHSDTTAYDEHMAPLVDLGFSKADTEAKAVCDKAKVNSQITIFTVAFEAPTGGEELLEYCATDPGFHFDVDGTDISDAFKSIAGHIALLRLTE